MCRRVFEPLNGDIDESPGRRVKLQRRHSSFVKWPQGVGAWGVGGGVHTCTQLNGELTHFDLLAKNTKKVHYLPISSVSVWKQSNLKLPSMKTCKFISTSCKPVHHLALHSFLKKIHLFLCVF